MSAAHLLSFCSSWETLDTVSGRVALDRRHLSNEHTEESVPRSDLCRLRLLVIEHDPVRSGQKRMANRWEAGECFIGIGSRFENLHICDEEIPALRPITLPQK